MTDIHIPPEALEAGARIIWARREGNVTAEDLARTAFVAMVEAWPGMTNYVGYEGDELVQIITLSAKVQ